MKILSATIVDQEVFRDPAFASVTYNGLPTFCRVRVVSTPVAGSRIGIEVWLPLSDWSGRLHMTGNGGYGPQIWYSQMAKILRSGDVAVATNTGHELGDEPDFAIGRPQSIIDWAHRAVHEAVVTAKSLVRAYYKTPLKFSYFSGCSTGGHQALMSAQRYPDDFDGILAGAPGNNRAPLMMSFLWQFVQNHRRNESNPILPKEKLVLLTRTVTLTCDPLDGVRDGVIADPRACRFDPASIQCRSGDSADCLTKEQVEVVRRMYEGPRDVRTGRQIYPGYPLGREGAAAYSEERPGWSEYWSDAEYPNRPRRADFFRFWAFDDQNWSWWDFDWGKDVDRVNNGIGKLVNANNPDLSAFREKGGKLIMFMGWADPVGAATEAANYYEEVEKISPGASLANRRKAAQDVLRLYMVPGMAHCNGGRGASNFTQNWGSPPIPDAKHDLVIALKEWVEQGKAPQEIIATKYVEDAPGKGVQFQRLLCVYPSVSRFRGGNDNLSTSFICQP